MRILREKLNHALPALLLSVGWLLPLLGVLHPSFTDPNVIAWVLAVVLLFEAASLRRWSAIAAASVAAVGVIIWLTAFGGLQVLQDVFIALSLRASGQVAALPLVASPVITVLSLLIPLLACFSMLRKASYLPSVLLTITVTMLVWLTDRMDQLPWLLPAFAAVLLRLITDHSEGVDPLRILPWAAALVGLAFVLTPRGGVSYPPLKEKADDLRQSVMDRLFFTEPRDVFSLSSEGFYPEGARQLGGTPELNDRNVMQVSTPRSAYLRGVVFNDYNGRCWTNTTGGRRYLWQSARLEDNRVRIFDQQLPAESARNAQCDPVIVSVRMLSDNASTLFVPQRIRALEPGGELVPYYSNASEVFVTRNLQAGDTWSVSAPLFQAGDSGLGRLIEASASFPDPAYASVLETYTLLPAHLEQPVYDLALEAASAGTTPYEKALAIQSWLSRSFRYTLEVADQPENIDFVTNFLLNTREGYCTYFASAMTVLCRMAGLPARYVEGYLAEPDANGNALVTGRSGHAWTEVYFSGFGWLTFDATPRHTGSNNDAPPASSPEPSSPPSDTPTPEPGDEPEPSDEQSEEPDLTPEAEPDAPTPSPEVPPPENPPETPPESSGSSLLWLSLLLILLLLAALLFRILFSSPVFREHRSASESDRFEVWAQELSDLLRAEGLVRRSGETPMAFMRRIDATPRFTVSLSPCGECISLIHYSRVHPLASDTALLRESAVRLKKELSPPARLRYLLRRIFLPLSRRNYARS